jgi:hypothetical protein
MNAREAAVVLGISARKVPYTREEIDAMDPASILLTAYFHERLGAPLDGITRFDIELAQCSWELEQQAREYAHKASGKPSAEDRYAQHLKDADTARRNAQAGKRRSAKMNRTPAWADPKAIRDIYRAARALTASTGIPHHVDHDLPLRGKLVSGLHVENNLRILPGPENCRKNNRFEVEE